MTELKAVHIFLSFVIIYILYNLINKCNYEGFSVGGQDCNEMRTACHNAFDTYSIDEYRNMGREDANGECCEYVNQYDEITCLAYEPNERGWWGGYFILNPDTPAGLAIFDNMIGYKQGCTDAEDPASASAPAPAPAPDRIRDPIRAPPAIATCGNVFRGDPRFEGMNYIQPFICDYGRPLINDALITPCIGQYCVGDEDICCEPGDEISVGELQNTLADQNVNLYEGCDPNYCNNQGTPSGTTDNCTCECYYSFSGDQCDNDHCVMTEATTRHLSQDERARFLLGCSFGH